MHWWLVVRWKAIYREVKRKKYINDSEKKKQSFFCIYKKVRRQGKRRSNEEMHSCDKFYVHLWMAIYIRSAIFQRNTPMVDCIHQNQSQQDKKETNALYIGL